ncbi:hypothetical protein SHJG_0174 [Streptomyces hygroscopicus subsp. jinggangensis 5008]|nr:hypothetical protein SHJG_0174 [Streptomyces hygroscopicus subsp. jinggangensis 5008]
MRLFRVLAELDFRTTLTQQVPALVEFTFQLYEAMPLF